jgi:single-strand DNA-binding protein
MNNVSLIGRLTGTPELKHTQSGKAYVKFSIAVDRQFVKQGEERQADFINILAWDKTAEFICKYFEKGRRMALTGRIQTGSYKDKDGNTRYTTDVVAENVEFCDSKGNNTDNSQQQQQKQQVQATMNNPPTATEDSGEDLPF